MNMQKLMQEAKRMQAQLEKDQKELEETVYEGFSSVVNITMNGKYEVKEVDIKLEEEINKDDIEMLEDMILVAFNDAINKINVDKEKKMGKYGQGLSGLM